MCITLWVLDGGKKTWELGYILDINSKKYTVEHLERVNTGNDKLWRYPLGQKDIQIVNDDTLLQCIVEGDWDISDAVRNLKFELLNDKDIRDKFAAAYDSIK